MRIAAIASMKRGLEQFIYRELEHIERAGADISLFPTKSRPGLYNPRPSWRVHRWSPLRAMLWQPWCFLCHPWTYVSLLVHALKLRALIDFVIAWDYCRTMSDADVIYATFGDHKLFIGYFCKRILNKPLAVEIHAYELYDNPNPALFAVALANCDQIITVTEHNRDLLESKFDVPPDRVEVVRCGVDLTSYRPGNKFIILIVAFFVERKGHEILLKAVQKLANPDLEVWVVGDRGAEKDSVDVRGLAARLGIEQQVAFFGKLSGTALRSVFHACDVFCLPCRFDSSGVAEGFPVAIIEAMAVGKPVITTRHVEIPRVVPEILVDENDIDGLADAIQQVYQSEALRTRLGQQNRQIAEKVFSVRNARRTKELLHRLVSTVEQSDPTTTPTASEIAAEQPSPVEA
ncbi:MAG: glycosyltransferase family 4 protein [Planctomycetes bacterium]|nr:glycosyltransferase family 4 protein [Planctomycetota bacterium]